MSDKGKPSGQTPPTPKKPKVPPLTEAQKSRKFIDLATKRATKAVKAIRQLGNLSSSNYVYDKEQVAKLAGILNVEVENMLARFDAKKAKTDIDIGL